IENQNTGGQAWPPQQVEAMRRLDVCLLQKMKRDTRYMLDHKTYAPTRKNDRFGMNVETERRVVQKMIINRQKPPPPPPDPWEEFFMSLTSKQKKNLIEFADAIDEFKTNSRSFVSQLLAFNRNERGQLRKFLDAIDEMDSSTRGQGLAVSTLWREAGARGWDRDIEKFKENRNYTEEELKNPQRIADTE
ncbi:MAG: hypothetical protein LC687_06180, partial [Actinobacteria bacterium]|nr:hypothetical protein [Actinomycetota bacterium]